MSGTRWTTGGVIPKPQGTVYVVVVVVVIAMWVLPQRVGKSQEVLACMVGCCPSEGTCQSCKVCRSVWA